jgi:hypothetical protein
VKYLRFHLPDSCGIRMKLLYMQPMFPQLFFQMTDVIRQL